MFHRRAGFVVVVVLSVLVAPACSGDDSSSAIDTTTSAPVAVRVPVEWLRAQVAALLHVSDAPGAIVGVSVHGGTPTFVADGIDPHTTAPLKVEDSFRIASLTKTFVGAVALRLVADQKLALADRVSKYVPDWPRGDEITVEMLLSHTSGLAPWGDDTGSPGPYAAEATDFTLSHYGKVVSPAEVLDIARVRPLLFAPGSSTAYSNINTILLGRIVSVVTGQTLGAALREHVLGPLHLGSTFYAPEEATPTPVAGLSPIAGPGTAIDTGTIDYTGAIDILGAAGGGVSTVGDLVSWGNAFLRSDRVVPSSLRTKAFRIRGGGTGLGVIGMERDGDMCVFAPDGCPKGTAFTAYGGSGAFDGVRAMLVYEPATDALVVAFANRDQVPGINAFVADVLARVRSLE